MSYKYILALMIFVLAIGFIGEHSLVNRIAQKNKIMQLEHDINVQIEQFNKDKETLNRLKNDPEAVVQIAHERYYMKQAGEDVFVIEDE
ncbi:MAG: septum formation initiator family protein [Prevotellaceae bacterium]|nr:septum formation initiator family protein [Candidatus Colivivens equi]